MSDAVERPKTYEEGIIYGFREGQKEANKLMEQMLHVTCNPIACALPETEAVKLLQKQIEKMKCWCNCQNWENCLFECAEKGKKFEKEFCFGCPKWQLDVKKLEKVRRKKMTNNGESKEKEK